MSKCVFCKETHYHYHNLLCCNLGRQQSFLRPRALGYEAISYKKPTFNTVLYFALYSVAWGNLLPSPPVGSHGVNKSIRVCFSFKVLYYASEFLVKCYNAILVFLFFSNLSLMNTLLHIVSHYFSTQINVKLRK